MIKKLILGLIIIDLVMKVPIFLMLAYLYFRQKKLDQE